MKFYQKWMGSRIVNDETADVFAAKVPGNIQKDFAYSKGLCDIMYGENCEWFRAYENDAWEYKTKLDYKKNSEEEVWFVSLGIDYKYDIKLNGEVVFSGEGMFSPIEINLTSMIKGEDELSVYIYPHPKNGPGNPDTKDEAAYSCKPPVCYGWDWNPRLLISGMWQEAYIETRNENYISKLDTTYRLAEDFSYADVKVDFECATETTITLSDAEGNIVYTGKEKAFRIENPKLWWCNGHGEQYLYHVSVESKGYRSEADIGFKRVKLVENYGHGGHPGYPLPCDDAPMTMELNGRRIFMKGSNWVNPELFWGDITEETYKPLLELAVDAHMNILRLWGGASFCKKPFYDLCDKMGILVWQEFMLGCNKYPDIDEYLAVLEKEASTMIRTLRSHACIALWCGGNELFNGWSGMTEQSLPLRLLGKLCYELDRDHPYIKTSPIMGMGHGGYMFYHFAALGGDVLGCFQRARCTAYTEFGVPSIAPMEELKKIITPEELEKFADTPSWRLHHAIGAFMPQSHACAEILKMYFGEPSSISEMIEQSNLLQSEGLKGIYEEARRQWPQCSGAFNWCYNEPWITAANLSIVGYPALPKPGYFAVKEALRPTMFSARVSKFDWRAGERFAADIWFLNDTFEDKTAKVSVVIKIGNEEIILLEDIRARAAAMTSAEITRAYFDLPYFEGKEICLYLRSDNPEFNSEYTFVYGKIEKEEIPYYISVPK